ncbi:metal ABC transporter solute-binding protein, Zn/Mn family [Arcobacter arenosus]|uniref:metal ABC transporter solute-binding protein, Zn/Mn family n=1 Tax=Arcobacter arenosus TaxID=2576037 RepID=UPI003BA9EAA2
MKKILIALALLSSFVVAKEVTVSILPQKFFVEKIAGDKIDVNVMVKPGASPASYEPKTSQMKKLSNSLAYFSIGVPFEKSWLKKFEDANKKMLVVDTTKGIEKQEMQAHEHHDEEAHDEHKHEEDHDHEKNKHEEDHDEHDHTGLDPHVWLDPILVKKQAENILNALIEVDEANKDFYTKNYQLFVKELDELDKKLESIIEPCEHKAFMVFHPSWGYFAKRYHLEQISIEIQGKEPKPAQLIELVEEAKKHDIKIVFVAPQFSQKGAKTISKSINGNVATINPLSEKWDENLLKVATEIAKSYK